MQIGGYAIPKEGLHPYVSAERRDRSHSLETAEMLCVRGRQKMGEGLERHLTSISRLAHRRSNCSPERLALGFGISGLSEATLRILLPARPEAWLLPQRSNSGSPGPTSCLWR